MTFVEGAKTCSTVEALLALFMATVAPCGVIHAGRLPIVGARGRPAIGKVVGVHDIAYQAAYLERGFVRSDPVLRAAIDTTTPILWSDIRQATTDPLATEVFDVAAEFGSRNGLVVPVHHRLGSVNAVVMSGGALDASPESRAFLHLIAIHFNAELERIELSGMDAASQRQILTARQIECLKWIAAGKSNWEIGEILGLSEHTVHRHVEMAKQRLNVHTRAQAVAALLRMQPGGN